MPHYSSTDEDKEEDDFRRQLEAMLGGRRFNELEWGYIRTTYFFEVQTGESTIHQAAKEIRETLQRDVSAEQETEAARHLALPPSKRPAADRHAPLGLREEAVAAILADEVAYATPVKTFRNEVLDGRLLSDDNLLEWLQQQERNQVNGDLWLTNSVVPVSVGEQLLAAVKKRYDELPHDAQGNLLPLSFPVAVDPRWIRAYLAPRYLICLAREPRRRRLIFYACRTSAGGVLEWLRRLGEQLATMCSWSEPEAVRFVLTDIPPAMPRIRDRVRTTGRTVRIELTIDPAVLPHDVAEYYRHVRHPITGRTRALDEKHLRLALFTVRQPRAYGELWRHYMDRWNQTLSKGHSDWKYTQYENFARDCDAAQAHLRWPDYNMRVSKRWSEPAVQAALHDLMSEGGTIQFGVVTSEGIHHEQLETTTGNGQEKGQVRDHGEARQS